VEVCNEQGALERPDRGDSMTASDRRAFLARTAAAAAALQWPLAGLAQSYPTRPVRLLVPYPPGGAGGIVARSIVSELGQELGQTLVVEERGGGAQVIATEIVANAQPDGYTALLASTTHGINPSLFKTLPYDTLKDFAPLTIVAHSPLIFLAHPSLGVTTIQQLVAKAKSMPGKIAYGTGGPGTGGHLSVELFKAMAGIDMLAVHYKGAGPLLNDFLGGQVQVVCTSPLPTMPHVRSGRLVGLAMTGAKRSAVAPEFPTVAESGFPGYQSTLWYALLTQVKTPAAIQQRLYEAAAKTLRLPAVVERFRLQGAEAVGNTPAEADAFIRAEIQRWAKVVERAQIKSET
jgi:tripartite-type tricarboxylate transporter receptor subunit TctC